MFRTTILGIVFYSALLCMQQETLSIKSLRLAADYHHWSNPFIDEKVNKLLLSWPHSKLSHDQQSFRLYRATKKLTNAFVNEKITNTLIAPINDLETADTINLIKKRFKTLITFYYATVPSPNFVGSYVQLVRQGNNYSNEQIAAYLILYENFLVGIPDSQGKYSRIYSFIRDIAIEFKPLFDKSNSIQKLSIIDKLLETSQKLQDYSACYQPSHYEKLLSLLRPLINEEIKQIAQGIHTVDASSPEITSLINTANESIQTFIADRRHTNSDKIKLINLHFKNIGLIKHLHTLHNADNNKELLLSLLPIRHALQNNYRASYHDFLQVTEAFFSNYEQLQNLIGQNKHLSAYSQHLFKNLQNNPSYNKKQIHLKAFLLLSDWSNYLSQLKLCELLETPDFLSARSWQIEQDLSLHAEKF